MDTQQLTADLTQKLLDYAPKVAGAILALIIGFWVIGRIVRALDKSLAKSQMDPMVRPYIKSLISIGLKVLLLLAVAKMFGIETTSFVAIMGALAFAIGMALQGTLGHFASGVLLLTFKPYRVGDAVNIQGNVGVVDELQIFNTVLKTPDNKRIIIPNGVVTSGVITNISGQGEMGVDIVFGIDYKADIDQARQIISDVAYQHPAVKKDPAVAVLVSELADNSVNLLARPWVESKDYWDVYFYMQEAVKKAFDEAGIGIPYPQVDVHMQTT